MSRFRIFFDMDGVLVDFDRYCREERQTPDEVKRGVGAYLKMPPIDGALDGIRKVMSIAGQYGGEVWLATKPPTGIPWAYADKVEWVLDHLPELKRRIIITHDKGLLGGEGDYLVDDRPWRANCDVFRGTLIRFGDATPPPGVAADCEVRARDWATLVPLLHMLMKAAANEGRGLDMGESLEDINAARGLLRLGPVRLGDETVSPIATRPAHGGYPDHHNI